MLSEINPPLQNGIWQFFFNCNCSSLFKFQPMFWIVLQPKSEVSNLQLAFGINHNCLLSSEFTVLIEFFISFLFGAELKETWDKSGKNGFCACLLVSSQNFLWQEKWWMVVCSVFFSVWILTDTKIQLSLAGTMGLKLFWHCISKFENALFSTFFWLT